MPYTSQAQERYFNANRAKMAAQGVNVNEFNQASKGLKLPAQAPQRKRTAQALASRKTPQVQY